MDKNKCFELLERAYSLTENTTPRRFDCGTLCGAVCCKNLSKEDSESGMALLPYEKEYLISLGAKGFTYKDTDDGTVLICNGHCDRRHRPFSCRIFPYYAKIDKEKIYIKKDLRAAGICPLLLCNTSKRPDIFFIRNIKKAVKVLSHARIYKKDFMKTSDFIDSLYDLYSKLK